MKYLILIGLIILIFTLVQNNKEKMAMAVIVFFLPFNNVPLIQFGLNLTIACYLILAYYFGSVLRGKQIPLVFRSFEISAKLNLLFYFVIVGFILGFINSEKYIHIDRINIYSASSQIFTLTAYYLIIIIFLKIILPFASDLNAQKLIIKSLLLSVFLQVLVIIFQYLNLTAILPAFLIGDFASFKDMEIKSFVIRYSGLYGDYECIIDYFMMVIGFSFILLFNNQNRFFATTAIITAILGAFLTGTRSFIIIIFIFLISLALLELLYSRSGKIKMRFIFFLVLFSIIFIFSYGYLRSKFIIFERLEYAYHLFNTGSSIEQASNRNYFEVIPFVIDHSGILGFGNFYFFSFYGDSSVSHNLFLAIYLRFGIVGIVFIMYIFISSFIVLFKSIRNKKNQTTKHEAFILLSLLLALFFQQLKISGLRNIQTMLLYTLFFVFVYFTTQHSKIKIN